MAEEIKSPQTIIGLLVENVKKIKLVNLSPDGKTMLITGANQQGKTSLVDALWWSVGGKNAMRKTDEPIREGEAEARAVVEFQDFIVERRITRKDSYLYVTLKDEAQTKVSSPQAFLKQFMSTISIDPTEILRMAPKEQVDILLKMFGIYDKVMDLDKKYQEIYQLRWAKGQERDSAVGALENMDPPPEGLPAEERSAQELSKKLTEAINFNNNLDQTKRDIDNRQDAIVNRNNDIASWENQIKELQEKIAQAKGANQQDMNQMDNLRTQIEGVNPKDTSSIETEISKIEEINTQIRAAKSYREYDAKVERLKEEYKDLYAECEAIQEKKLDIIQSVDMPVEGLSIDDRGLVFGPTKRPMEQLSDSERLKIATAIAMAEKPTIRILRITHGESLDDNSFNMVKKMAEDNGYQLIVEKVDTSGKLGIVLEEGEVVANNKQLTHSEGKE